MTERYYDARTADTRFSVQYPHISGHYAVLDREGGGLVAIGYEEHALGMVEALNAAVDPEIDEVDLVTALREVNPAHRWLVMDCLTHLVRGKVKEGFEPTLDVKSLDDHKDTEAARRITEALTVAVFPKTEPISLASALGITVLENPSDALKMVPEDHEWRVSLTLARLFRQALDT